MKKVKDPGTGHIPEPLYCVPLSTGCCMISYQAEGKTNFIPQDEITCITVANHPHMSEKQVMETGKRLVDCYNACKGIANPETDIPEILAALERAADYIEELPYPENYPAKDLRAVASKITQPTKT